MENRNRFYLGEKSKEILISGVDAPLFEEQAIRMAGITEVNDEYLCLRHNPLHYTLLLTVDGCGELLVADESLLLSRYTLVVLKKGQDFQYHVKSKPWHFVWFILEDHDQWSLLQGLPLRYENVICSDVMKCMLFLLASNTAHETKRILNQDIYQLLLGVLQMDADSRSAGQRLHNIMFEVSRQLQFPWTVASLARKMHCSEPTLHRVFQKHLGVSPMQKVIDLRIQRACFLLKNTSWKLNDIASQVGYRDGLNLSRAFKKKMGVSPEEFRSPPDRGRDQRA